MYCKMIKVQSKLNEIILDDEIEIIIIIFFFKKILQEVSLRPR